VQDGFHACNNRLKSVGRDANTASSYVWYILIVTYTTTRITVRFTVPNQNSKPLTVEKLCISSSASSSKVRTTILGKNSHSNI